MPLGVCENKHTYNRDKHGDTCPICGLVSRKAKEEGKTKEEIEAMLKLPESQYVCGWLVCVEGINKGRAYTVHADKNFIGSGDDMDVQILGDDKVDRYRHAILSFDGRKLEATLLPGESRGLVYLNDNAIYVPAKLEEGALIEVGNTLFKYIPFCGPDFQWPEQSKET